MLIILTSALLPWIAHGCINLSFFTKAVISWVYSWRLLLSDPTRTKLVYLGPELEQSLRRGTNNCACWHVEWLLHASLSLSAPICNRYVPLAKATERIWRAFQDTLAQSCIWLRMKRTGVPWLLSNMFNVMITTTGAGTASKSGDPDHLSSCVLAYTFSLSQLIVIATDAQ